MKLCSFCRKTLNRESIFCDNKCYALSKKSFVSQRNQEVIDCYNALNTPTLNEVGRKFNITRERVRQILKRTGIKTDAHTRFIKVERICKVCERDLRFIKRASFNLCKSCETYSKIGKHTQIRALLYPKNCRSCGKEIGVNNRAKGLCLPCWRTDKAYWKNPAHQKWVANNKDKLRAYARKYWSKNKAKKQQYYKAYYLKKKQLLLDNNKSL